MGYNRMSARMPIFVILGVILVFAGILALVNGARGNGISPSVTAAFDQRVTEEVVYSNLRQLSSLECASYNGSVFVRESVPLRILGMRVSNAQLWLSTPGTVRASVDLSGLDRGAVQQIALDGRMSFSIMLPEPQVTGIELNHENSTHGRSPMLIIGGNADEVAQAEDRMLETARDQLHRQAEDMGLLGRARSNAEMAVRELVRGLIGDPSLQVDIAFESGMTVTSPAELSLDRF
jgi:hypothetical protein